MVKNNKFIWMILVAIVLVLLAFFLFFNNYNNSNSNSNSDGDYNSDGLANSLIQNSFSEDFQQNLENCSIEFTDYLVDPKYVLKVGQIGVVHGSGKTIVERSYISVKSNFTGKKVPIYAPVDMTLTSGSHYGNPATAEGSLPDYALWFDAGCGVEVNLAHLKEVVESIALQLPEIKTDSRSIQLEKLKFKAGDLIGYFIYNEGGVAGFDFIVRDQSFTNQFINQERYEGDRARNLIHGVCPYDFYTGEKKQDYYNLLGGAGGKLFNVKDCGNASRDLAGTISGMWFLDKEITGSIYENYYNEGDYGNLLSITGDEESVTIGYLGQSNILRVYSNEPTYKLPTQVMGEHCYQFSSNSVNLGYAYFKVIDKMTMDIYYTPSGSCPLAMPEGGKRYYK